MSWTVIAIRCQLNASTKAFVSPNPCVSIDMGKGAAMQMSHAYCWAEELYFGSDWPSVQSNCSPGAPLFSKTNRRPPFSEAQGGVARKGWT